MKISKRVREEAIWLCAVAASNIDVGLSDAAFYLDRLGHDAFELAMSAKRVAVALGGYGASTEYELACAEAEALLRTGWTP